MARMSDADAMRAALDEARAAAEAGEVPIGAVVVRDERPANSISAGAPAKTVGWRG